MQTHFMNQPQASTAVVFGDKVKLISRIDSPYYNAGVIAGKLLAEGKLTEAQICESLGIADLEAAEVGRIALDYQRIHGQRVN